MSISYLGIGSNIGNRELNCKKAINCLRNSSDIYVLRCSSLYNTKPVGGPVQSDFLNGIIEIKTDICPEYLLAIFKKIETDIGRIPGELNYPRVIDIDILFYDNCIIDTSKLKIPHPRLHKRYFVLKGLEELAPNFIHPVLFQTVSELYDLCYKDGEL